MRNLKKKAMEFIANFISYPLKKTFTKENADIHLKKKLEAELQGIFNFAIDGLKRLRANQYQFTTSTLAENTLAEYKKEINPMYTFIDDCIVPDVDGFVKSSLLHDRFVEWCKEEGHNLLANLSKNHLPRKLVSALAELKVEAKADRKQDRGVSGIRLRTSPASKGTSRSEAKNRIVDIMYAR